MSNVYTVVGVASGVGATGITAGLGRSLADTGESVLLIDWDRSTPDLAARMGLPDPEFTIRDLETGEVSIATLAYTGASGVRFIPGSPVDGPCPDDGRMDLSGILDNLDGIDATVLIDTGNPSTPAATDAFEASDGVLIVSAPDSTARRHDAIRQSLRKDGHRPLGTVLSRVNDTTPAADEPASGVLARVPEVDSPRTLPGGAEDPRTDAYRRLADELERIESSPDSDEPRSTIAGGSTTAEQQSEDGFVTPSLADPADRAVGPSSEYGPATDADDGERKVVGRGADGTSATNAGGEDEHGDSTTAENERADQATSTAAKADADTTADAAAPATAVEGQPLTASADRGDDKLQVSRRAALTLITGLLAAISGGSLWIAPEKDEPTESSPETATEEVVGFGYGGTPIAAGSAAAVSTATVTATTESEATGDQTDTSTATVTPTNSTTVTPTITSTPTNTATATPTTTSAPAPQQDGSGGISGGSSEDTSTTTTTTTTTDDGDDDYGEIGYGEGGYGGTI